MFWCLIFLVGGQPIGELNKGVSQFIDEVRDDEMAAVSVELGIVTAGERRAQEEMAITPMQNVGPAPTFQANGARPLGKVVEIALSMLDSRTQEYRNAGVPYYQPWLVIIGDGIPSDDWQGLYGKKTKSKRKIKGKVSKF